MNFETIGAIIPSGFQDPAMAGIGTAVIGFGVGANIIMNRYQKRIEDNSLPLADPDQGDLVKKELGRTKLINKVMYFGAVALAAATSFQMAQPFSYGPEKAVQDSIVVSAGSSSLIKDTIDHNQRLVDEVNGSLFAAETSSIPVYLTLSGSSVLPLGVVDKQTSNSQFNEKIKTAEGIFNPFSSTSFTSGETLSNGLQAAITNGGQKSNTIELVTSSFNTNDAQNLQAIANGASKQDKIDAIVVGDPQTQSIVTNDYAKVLGKNHVIQANSEAQIKKALQTDFATNGKQVPSKHEVHTPEDIAYVSAGLLALLAIKRRFSGAGQLISNKFTRRNSNE